ncbi:MAG: GNAT family N-acetyltransferase [Oscillospiraceae bacterium]
MHFEIAFTGSTPVGISMFAINTGTIYGLLPKGCGTIMGFYIIPECRHRGYGKEFYEHIEESLNTQNSVMLYLTPDGVTDKPFWKAVGFIDSGKIDPDSIPFTIGWFLSVSPISLRVSVAAHVAIGEELGLRKSASNPFPKPLSSF